MAGGWRYTNEAMPTVGRVVEVWLYTRCVAAVWDGDMWQVDGAPVAPVHVLNWREYRA